MIFALPMKHFYLMILLVSTVLYADSTISESFSLQKDDTFKEFQFVKNSKDTCLIEGNAFIMKDYRSTKVLRAYIKNSQIFVVNDGLQYAKFRIIGYVFSSLDNEAMPSFRWYNQRISPPILQILKNSRVGDQFLFEDIVVVDQLKKTLANEVRPLLIERIKN
jgi:hypothetical protein